MKIVIKDPPANVIDMLTVLDVPYKKVYDDPGDKPLRKFTDFKDLIAASGMSQSEFANHFGCKKQSIQKWCLTDESVNKRTCAQYILDLFTMALDLREE